MQNPEEIEVFRCCNFSKDKYYVFALYTRVEYLKTEGHEKHYTTNNLLYVGKWVRSERWGGGGGDGRGGAEIFINNDGVETRIVYDYEGFTCFREAISIS